MCHTKTNKRLLSELISLQGQAAVITGGASGAGLAIAERLAEAGADILIADYDLSASANAAYMINSRYHVKAIASDLDVTSGESVKETCAQALRELGSINIWVNTTEIYSLAPILEITDNQWDKIMRINLRGVFIASREAAAHMVIRGAGGVIINVASTAALKVSGHAAHYVTSKHGLAGLTKALATELGSQGIRALAVAPTIVDTADLDILKQNYGGLADQLHSYAGSLPLKRVANPDDIARVVLFCASDLSSFMTGCIIPVDGGDMAL